LISSKLSSGKGKKSVFCFLLSEKEGGGFGSEAVEKGKKKRANGSVACRGGRRKMGITTAL